MAGSLSLLPEVRSAGSLSRWTASDAAVCSVPWLPAPHWKSLLWSISINALGPSLYEAIRKDFLDRSLNKN